MAEKAAIPSRRHEIVQIARTWAPDAYIAALLAPHDLQPDLIALAAFCGDVERIVETVSEPTIAEIRLQWWREAVIGAASGALTGDPKADALGEAVRRHGLPSAQFDDLLDARALDLYADPLADEPALSAYLEKTDGRALQWAARVRGASGDVSPLIAAAGQAIGLTRLVRRLPVILARGRSPFPGGPSAPDDQTTELARRRAEARSALDEALCHWRTSSKADRGACLPLAVVKSYLSASDRLGGDAGGHVVDIQPLDRIWRLGRAHAFGWF
jgi:phytoene synthase